jgi:hypothetical protein
MLQAADSGALREAICVNVPLRVTPLSYVTTMSRRWTTLSFMPSFLDRLGVSHRRWARLAWDMFSIVSPSRSPLWTARRIVRRGRAVTFLMGPWEQGDLAELPLWRLIWGWPLVRTRRFHAVALPDADHAVRSAKGQDEAIAAIHRRLGDYTMALGSGSAVSGYSDWGRWPARRLPQ